MMYYCYENISCINDEVTKKIRDDISCHFNDSINLKNKESVIVKYALCRILEEFYGLKDYTISSDDNGKPFIENEPLHFSLSHSEDMIFCVVSEENVGCDVQVMSEFKEKIARRFFTGDEYSALIKSKNQDGDFTKLWTVKEAILKYTGEGLLGGLSSYDFSDCINKSMFNKYGLNFSSFVKGEYVFSICFRETESCLYELKMGGD